MLLKWENQLFKSLAADVVVCQCPNGKSELLEIRCSCKPKLLLTILINAFQDLLFYVLVHHYEPL